MLDDKSNQLTTHPARLDFNKDIIFSKLWEWYGDDAELLGLGVSGVQHQHFLFLLHRRSC
jgi:hypothetical protein